jgi:DNA polymerase I-like protein with 3'-5' exonuclease and polymerase domains
MIKRPSSTTDADNLRELDNRLRVKGYESEILKLRLAFNDQAAILGYVKAVMGEERVYPHFLPTQASGRWSVTNPPLTNWTPDIRDCIVPDPGYVWIGWDLDAIEGKIVAAFSHDRDDLAAFDNGWDIHTITACRMQGVPLPPNLKDPHQSPESAEWRNKLGWKGKDDIRRVTAKVRYCLLYGKDWTAVNGSKYEKDMVKLGFKREVLQNAAKAFLRSKPNLIACKRKYWDECAKKGEARTIFGRRRRLFGDYWSRAKEGWNHMVQGSVTDMVNKSLIDITSNPALIQPILVYPSHDAAKISIPATLVSVAREQTLEIFKSAVEREWVIDGEKIKSTATWHIYHADGLVEHL